MYTTEQFKSSETYDVPSGAPTSLVYTDTVPYKDSVCSDQEQIVFSVPNGSVLSSKRQRSH